MLYQLRESVYPALPDDVTKVNRDDVQGAVKAMLLAFMGESLAAKHAEKVDNSIRPLMSDISDKCLPDDEFYIYRDIGLLSGSNGLIVCRDNRPKFQCAIIKS